MTLKPILAALAFTLASAAAHAHSFKLGSIEIGHPYARATAAGQPTGGGFLKLTNGGADDKLLSASAAVSASVELHEMKMEGDVMRMRAVPKLDLPAGQTIELKPGGYHLMLTDLKQALQKDTVVPVTLVFRNARGLESRMDVSLPVQMQGPDGAAGGHKH